MFPSQFSIKVHAWEPIRHLDSSCPVVFNLSASYPGFPVVYWFLFFGLDLFGIPFRKINVVSAFEVSCWFGILCIVPCNLIRVPTLVVGYIVSFLACFWIRFLVHHKLVRFVIGNGFRWWSDSVLVLRENDISVQSYLILLRKLQPLGCNLAVVIN